MDEDSSKEAAEDGLFAGEAWFDPLEAGIRGRIRGLIEELVEQELEAALGRGRYERGGGAPAGHRHGHRRRRLTGSFGPVEVAVPRARLRDGDGGATPGMAQRRAAAVRPADPPARGADRRRPTWPGPTRGGCSGHWRRCSAGAVGKDVVSRAWRKVKVDWEAWCRRSLAEEDIVRLILDGTVVRVRLDRKATSISLLVVLGIRRDGQKVLLAVRNMGGESEAAWRSVLDDLVARGLRTPEFLITDGAAGLEKALAALWPAVPAQRCTVHKHRNLLAHAPERLHEEISADYTDMIYAETAKEIEARRRAFLRKWRLKCRAVADSLEEAGERAVRLHPPASEPVEVGADHQRHRAPPRRVQAPDQDADRAALGRDGGDAVLGAARLGPDRHAQGRRLAEPRSAAS